MAEGKRKARQRRRGNKGKKTEKKCRNKKEGTKSKMYECSAAKPVEK